MALVVMLMAFALMTVLGAGLLLMTTTEIKVTRNFRSATEALYAADGALAMAMGEVAAQPDWTLLLNGSLRSAFVDGPPGGTRVLPGGGELNLDRLLDEANCGKATTCSEAEMSAITVERPWGPNNPRWQLFAHGRMDDLIQAANSSFYLVVLVGDDSADNDGDPLRDGASRENPGSGVVVLRAEAFGPWSAHNAIEATLARPEPDPAGGAPEPGLRILSWREQR